MDTPELKKIAEFGGFDLFIFPMTVGSAWNKAPGGTLEDALWANNSTNLELVSSSDRLSLIIGETYASPRRSPRAYFTWGRQPPDWLKHRELFVSEIQSNEDLLRQMIFFSLNQVIAPNLSGNSFPYVFQGSPLHYKTIIERADFMERYESDQDFRQDMDRRMAEYRQKYEDIVRRVHDGSLKIDKIDDALESIKPVEYREVHEAFAHGHDAHKAWSEVVLEKSPAAPFLCFPADASSGYIWTLHGVPEEHFGPIERHQDGHLVIRNMLTEEPVEIQIVEAYKQGNKERAVALLRNHLTTSPRVESYRNRVSKILSDEQRLEAVADAVNNYLPMLIRSYRAFEGIYRHMERRITELKWY